MASWSLLVVALVAILGLEVLVFRYANGDLERSTASTPAGDANRDESVPAGGHESSAHAPSGNVDRCRRCGTANDATVQYTFCRGCLRRVR